MNETIWFVAHTRPRREKKLKQYCEREGFHAVLPCFRTVRKYRGKTAVFFKPLFPGYLFIQLTLDQRQKVAQNDHVARLLTVPDPVTFARQLEEILKALETALEIVLAPEIGAGQRVKIKSGPLKGMEAWVEERYGVSTVLLRLDFIGQAAAVKVSADELELT
jgi:transcription antitermination factor NusG